MLSQWFRVFHKDNGVFKDFSVEAQSLNSDTFALPYVAAEDKLYIAQQLPFNNFFVDFGTVNTAASVMNVEYWSGNAWATAKDIVDGTKLSGASLGKSGVVQFTTDRDDNWEYIVDTEDENGFDLQSDIALYNQYFLRISFSNDLDAGTILKNMSYSFTTNESLNAIDSEVDSFLTAWGGVSKTDWNEQIMLASQQVVLDLRSRGLITHPGQVLRFDDVHMGTTYKTLSLIYSGLGPQYNDKRDFAISEGKRFLSLNRFSFDTNEDARLSRGEHAQSIGRGVR
jgi:hypothetical protein